MTFSIYLDQNLGAKLTDAAKRSGQTRNSLIRRALSEWLGQHRAAKWPEAMLAFKGIHDAPRFETHRKKLKPPREPFGR